MQAGSDVAGLQHQIRQNAEELHQYVKDVHEWQKQCEERSPPGTKSGPARSSSETPKVEVESIRERGNVQFRAGQYAAAARTYSECLEHDPNDAKALANRAAASLKLGRYADAERDCTAALARDPDNVKVLLRRGSARAAMQKTYSAILDFEAVVRVAGAGTPPAAIAQKHLETLRAKPPRAVSWNQVPAAVRDLPRRRMMIEEVSDDDEYDKR